MGSAQENTKTEKKKILKDLKNKLYGVFQKKKCDRYEERVPVQDNFESNVNQPPKPISVAALLADFDRLKLEKAKREESIKSEIDEDELQNFSYKVVKKEQNTSRSSNDSGFTEGTEKSAEELVSSNKECEENQVLNEVELVETIRGLRCEDEDSRKKNKKTQQVYIARGKETQKGFKAPPFAPYQTFSNRQILSGGYVTVNPVENAYSDINLALSNVDRTVSIHAHTTQDEMLENLQIADEFVSNDTSTQQNCNQQVDSEINAELHEIILLINSEFEGQVPAPNFEVFTENVNATANPIEEFHLNEVPRYCDDDTSLTETLGHLKTDISKTNSYQQQQHDTFLTPPRSNENVFNPDSPANSLNNNRSIYSVHSPLSEYTLSPSNEQYQEIPVLPDLPESVLESEQNSNSPKERRKSSTSLNFKQFKEIQNQLSSEFAKGECCKKDVGLARERFKEMFMKLDENVREGLCLRLTALPLDSCYGLLHHILMGLSCESEREGMLCAVFSLICERVLCERPGLFLEDFGLNLLKAATLRCSARPELTRYLVQTIRLALETPAGKRLELKEVVFRETDMLGDTLLGAAARRGDSCADVLAELVRARSGQLPLFPVDHCNNDGMSALHVACAGHGAKRSLRSVHVLLQHAGADIWLGDIRGGDTALHYAVKPGNCDLDLVMTLFKHVDTKMWKKLAHASNRGNVSPIETARAACNYKVSRYNYPEEVLSFLRKCRT